MSVNIERLESIKRDNSTPKEFAKAHFDLASEYKENGQFEKAKNAYLEIKKDDDEDIFSYANYYLGIIFIREKSYYDAINTLSKVTKDYEDIYSKSQYLLGQIFNVKSDFNEAIKHLKEVKKDKIRDFYYYNSQYILSKLFRDHLNDKENSKKYFKESKKILLL